MMKIEDINAVVEEAVDLAYEKACEVVTERVKEETVKGAAGYVSGALIIGGALCPGGT